MATAAISTEEPLWGMKGPHCVALPELLPASSSGVSVTDCEHVGGRLTNLSSVLQAECKGRLFTNEKIISNLDKWEVEWL